MEDEKISLELIPEDEVTWPEPTEEQKKLAEELLKRVMESHTGPRTFYVDT